VQSVGISSHSAGDVFFSGPDTHTIGRRQLCFSFFRWKQFLRDSYIDSHPTCCVNRRDDLVVRRDTSYWGSCCWSGVGYGRLDSHGRRCVRLFHCKRVPVVILGSWSRQRFMRQVALLLALRLDCILCGGVLRRWPMCVQTRLWGVALRDRVDLLLCEGQQGGVSSGRLLDQLQRWCRSAMLMCTARAIHRPSVSHLAPAEFRSEPCHRARAAKPARKTCLASHSLRICRCYAVCRLFRPAYVILGQATQLDEAGVRKGYTVCTSPQLENASNFASPFLRCARVHAIFPLAARALLRAEPRRDRSDSVHAIQPAGLLDRRVLDSRDRKRHCLLAVRAPLPPLV